MTPELETNLTKQCEAFGLDRSQLDLIGESPLEVKNFTIKIVRDDDPSSPLEDDNGEYGKLVCWSKSYNLGHENPSVTPESYQVAMIEEAEPGFEEMLSRFEHNWPMTSWDAEGTKAYREQRHDKIQKRLEKYFVMLPLYLYDHGGLSMSTGSFSCPWDSGQVGFIYRSKEAIRKKTGLEKANPIASRKG